jgi:dipeptidase E
MGKIVAIGGGNMRAFETLTIDREVIELTGRTHCRALFIPTASYDSEQYWEGFQRVYGGKLGCDTSVLYLLNQHPTFEELNAQILSADLIYVGGGNTLKMMRRWRKLGVDRLLQAAYEGGVVLAGVSAGAICWFNYGHSDSMAFYHPNDWRYIRVRGMGLVGALACPHFDGETAGVKRSQDFKDMIWKHGGIGMAMDNHCALVFIDDGFKVMTSRAGAGAYKIYREDTGVIVEEIVKSPALRPVSTLLEI